MKAVYTGLSHMSRCRYVHLDIKLENCYYNLGKPMIGDFGLARLLNKDAQKNRIMCGTATYYSIEMVNRHSINTKTDVWSAGVLFYELVFMSSPFEVKKDTVGHHDFTEIKNGNYLAKIQESGKVPSNDLLDVFKKTFCPPA